MTLNDNGVLLKRHQKEIPPSCMNKPHVIVQQYCVLQVIQFGVRRAKEGIADLRVGDFKLVEDEVWGHRAWVKVTRTLWFNIFSTYICSKGPSSARTTLTMRKMWPTVDRSPFLTCWFVDLISVLIRFCYNLFSVNF